MNKFDRILSTLVLLQTRKILKANTIVERFGISLRTVYRDISTLKNAGIPIIGDPGIGYSIVEGYRLPPIMFNEGEATALLTAEKFIGSMTDKDTEAYYASALMKIKAILRSAEKESLEILNDSIVISERKNVENQPYLQEILKSIAAKQVLHIQYQKADDSITDRKLEPIGCYHQYNKWYLVAFCQLKNDYRTFKLNRITNLHSLDVYFDTKHISLQDYIDRQGAAWKAQQQFYAIEIAFSQTYVKFAEGRKFYFGFTEQWTEGDMVHIKFLNSSIEIMARWLLQFGKEATVLAPKELKDRMKVLAHEMYAHYKD